MLRPTRIDLPLLIMGFLLAATLTAYFSGLFPYPYGFLVLGFAFLGRYLQLRSMK